MKTLKTLSSICRKLLRRKPASSSYVLYQSCSQLPLDLFISCLCEQKLLVLIIQGNPPADALQQAWRGIQEEYAELVKNEAQGELTELHAEVASLQNRLFRISMVVECLQVVYRGDLVELLKEEFMPFDYNPEFPAQYYRDLKATVDRTRGLHLQLKLKQQELDAWYTRIASSSNTEKVSRDKFDEILAALSESNHFMIDESKITVAQYARLLNRYHAKMIAQQKEIEKRNQ
jgi:hypothetical protein